jgi:hypothetical protein
VLRDDEYTRLQTILLAIAKHSDEPHERVRWFALVQACQEELLTAAETRAKLRMSALPLCVQPVSATPLVVYRLAFRSPRSFADVD